MTRSIREDLLGYVLGALDETERLTVEQELSRNAQLLEELTRLKRCTDQIGMDERPNYYEPPAGLALRTCEAISRQAVPPVVACAGPGLAPALSSEVSLRRKYSFADVTAMVAVVAAAAALFFPALSNSRFQADVSVCQNRLRQIGMAYHGYSDQQPDHAFPTASLVGNRNVAGVGASILTQEGYLEDPQTLICPASPLGQHPEEFRLIGLDTLDASQGDLLEKVCRNLAGSFGMNIGYQQNGELRPAVDHRRPGYALAADAPADETPCRRTINHSRLGQNVLYEDGHVQFIRGSCTTLPDDPFHNINREVAPGLSPDDAVIAESSFHPLPLKRGR
jgi:hypothetical protein